MSYIEEILTVCRPHILVIALPWSPKIKEVVKGFCAINEEFQTKIVLSRDETWLKQESKIAEEISDMVLEGPGGAFLKVNIVSMPLI